MARQAWQRTITDAAGNVLTGVQITVFQENGVTLATIYGQQTGGAALANPFSTGVQTSAKFYADPGRYVVRAFKDGLTQEFTDVDISGKSVREDLGSAAYLTATTIDTDRTAGRALRVGDHGIGTTFRGRVDVLGGQTPAQIVALHGEGFIYDGTIQNHGGATPEAWGIISGYITSGNAYSYSYQEFTGIYAGKYRRTAQAGGNGWNPWVPVYDGASSLGTVAFSGGVNTGAIIERGANSNGEYTKFADGTMICSKEEILTQSTPVGDRQIYLAWTLPAAATQNLFCSVRGQFRATPNDPLSGIYTVHYPGQNVGSPLESGWFSNLGILASAFAIPSAFPPLGATPAQALSVSRFFFGRWR